MPLVRPAFAALVVLETTWIYNDFFWALLLMKSGERMPITSALNNLKGNFFVDNNLIAAGAIIVALPTMIVFFAAPEAVHQRPDARVDEGLIGPVRSTRSRTKRRAQKSPRVAASWRSRSTSRPAAISSAPVRSPTFGRTTMSSSVDEPARDAIDRSRGRGPAGGRAGPRAMAG